MDRLEKAEKVREKTGVSFEDAKTALEACDYDVLDAIVWLEHNGKTSTGAASYTTSANGDYTSDEMSQAQSAYEQATKRSGFTDALNRVLDWVKAILKKGVETSFVVERKGQQVLSVPTLLLILLAVFAFWIVLPLLVVGLFFDFKYHFEGIGAVTVDINEVASKAADAAENLKKDVTGTPAADHQHGAGTNGQGGQTL